MGHNESSIRRVPQPNHVADPELEATDTEIEEVAFLPKSDIRPKHLRQ